MDMLNQKQKIIIVALIVLAVCIIFFQYISSTKEIYSYEDRSNLVEEKSNELIKKEINEERIVVHITGAVKNSGIVKVKQNARINDVIEAAGGTTSDADLNKVNLAYIVEDGQKIYIPSLEDKDFTEGLKESISEDAGANIIQNMERESIININKVGLEELKNLPGIGEAIALKIIQYRKEHGKFKNIEELKNVSGIGDEKFNKMKNLICI